MTSTSSGLYLSPAGGKGLGVFTDRTFQLGEILLCFQGPRIPAEEVTDFTHTIQVDVSTFLGASGGLDDYVNHSCRPNAGIRSSAAELELVALRRIEPGEEVTFDYSTCIELEPELPSCGCRTSSCRGRIGPFRDLPPSIRRAYEKRGVVPAFLLPQAPGWAGTEDGVGRPRAQSRAKGRASG